MALLSKKHLEVEISVVSNHRRAVLTWFLVSVPHFQSNRHFCKLETGNQVEISEFH